MSADSIASAHEHWDAYTPDGEMELFRKFHRAVVGPSPDGDTARGALGALADLARSKGYGEEDAFRHWLAGRDPEELRRGDPDDAAYLAMHEDDPDSLYTHSIGVSVSAILRSAETDEGRSLTHALSDTMEDARLEGRRLRREEAAPASPAPGR